MKKMENALWQRARVGLEPHLNMRRIENDAGEGDPDVYWTWPVGLSGWFEMKAKEKPARATTKVFWSEGLRDAQISRIRDLCNDGVHVDIFARVGHTLFLVDGSHHEQFNTYTFVDLLRVARWLHNGNMKKANWADLAAAIKAF